MLGYSEPFSLVVLEQLDAPECPVQVEHAQKLENIDVQVDVVPLVEFGVERHFLEGKSAEVLEARVVLAEVVEGRLAQEVGDIVGEVVGAEVVVIDEVDTELSTRILGLERSLWLKRRDCLVSGRKRAARFALSLSIDSSSLITVLWSSILPLSVLHALYFSSSCVCRSENR